MREEATKRLLEVIKSNRYTLNDLARWLGVKYNAVYKKITSTHSYTLDDIYKIGQVLGKKNINYIFLDSMFEK